MSSDGKYLYIHTSSGLFKIGSGYGGTLRGHVYAHNMDYFPEKTGWLGYANVCIFKNHSFSLISLMF